MKDHDPLSSIICSKHRLIFNLDGPQLASALYCLLEVSALRGYGGEYPSETPVCCTLPLPLLGTIYEKCHSIHQQYQFRLCQICGEYDLGFSVCKDPHNEFNKHHLCLKCLLLATESCEVFPAMN